jgi:hypothetical protein
LNIIAYIIINILLFATWYFFLFRLKYLLSFVDRIISTFILGLTQVIATEILLGVVFKKLYAAELLLVNIFISSAVLIYVVSSHGRESEGSGINYTKSLLVNIYKEISDKVVWFFAEMKNDLVLFSVFILFLVSIFWIIFLGYLFPSYTWDALWYHLPIAGYIMQSGAIQEVPNSSFIDQFINIFPKNIELFFLWNIIFLHSDVITDLSQLLFTVVSVFSIYGIAVRLKVNKRHAIYSSLLFFFTPIIILQSSTNYVDVAVSALFLMAVNFLMSRDFNTDDGMIYLRKRKLLTAMAGLATGLLLGSKGSGPLFVGILSVVFIIQEFIWRFKSFGQEKITAIKIAIQGLKFYLNFFLVPLILMGGYWYIKNWIRYGNPVHPMEISFLNITIFKGLYQGIIEPAPEIINKLHPVIRPLYVWLENVEYYLYDSRLGGLGPIWFILFLPGLVFSIVYAIVKRNYKFIALFIIFTAAFLMHPRNWNPRYVIFIVGLGAISFGLVFDYFRGRNNIFRMLVLFLVVYTFFTSNSPCVTPKQIKKFMQLPLNERTIAVQAPFNIDLLARQDYGYWIWISRNISQGETLAYTFEPLFLSPLWNSGFSNSIVYIKSDEYKQWLKELVENNATYVLVRSNSAEDKWIEYERKIFSTVGWIAALKEKFKIVYADDNYKIARFITSVPNR